MASFEYVEVLEVEEPRRLAIQDNFIGKERFVFTVTPAEGGSEIEYRREAEVPKLFGAAAPQPSDMGLGARGRGGSAARIPAQMREGTRIEPWTRSRLLLVAVLALATLATLLAAPGRAAAATACPGSFRVLHDDRIGKLRLPEGPYRITVLNERRLSCSAAGDLFTQFLEDFDGRLPSPWRLNAGSATFRRGAGSAIGFRVAPLGGGGGGGGGGGRHPATGRACPGFFTVLHNDRIGRLRLPAGKYRITLLSVNRLGCPQAVKLFSRFLEDWDGVLPAPWFLDVATATFMRGSRHVGFRVKGAVGPDNGGGGGGIHPDGGGMRCPGTFRVLHNDRIGALVLPRGPYRITLLQRRGLTCAQASALFTRFLQDFSGVLPPPWRVRVENAGFRRGKGGVGFRVKQAF